MKRNLFEFNYNAWLFGAVLLGVFVISAGFHYQQFETWKKNPQAFFVGERPMMTTLDAPYWLRWAREYNEGIYLQQNGLRGYPDGTDFIEKAKIPREFQDTPAKGKHIDADLTVEEMVDDGVLGKNEGKHNDFVHKVQVADGEKDTRYRDVPLLSYLIAHLAPFFNYNYYLTGTLLIPFLASLFILPLGIYFFRIGFPLSGLLGGLIGTFASAYYMRSSIGRIDTDMLNLFFPVMAGLLILMAGKAKTERNVLIYVIGAGFILFLFQWWYEKAGFTLAYFLVLIFSLFVMKIRLGTILVASFLFVLFVNPATFISGAASTEGFLKNYLSIEEAKDVLIDDGTSQASFPNTMSTISEADHVQMDVVFRRILSNTSLGWIGLLAFLGLMIFRWRFMLPLVPMLALGLLSFQSSNRFIMYLAPFIGIGLGFLLQFVMDRAFYFFILRRKESNKTNSIAKNINQTGSKVVRQRDKDAKGLKTQLPETGLEATNPSNSHSPFHTSHYLNWIRQGALYLGMGVFFWLISEQLAISFVPRPSIHTRVYDTFLEVKTRVPEDSVLLTWWDYGYAISDATRLATFHDGGNQTTPKTFFIARGLISADPVELYDITQYLATEGNSGISEDNTSPDALLAAVRNPQQKPWDPIFLFFTADMTGKYGAISKLGSWDVVKGGSKPRGYQNLACNKITNVAMDCRGAKIDLKAGKINNQVPLKRMVFIRDGKVMREQEFGHPQGYSLQLLVAGREIVEVQLIDEVVFRSNYNQMFLLGRFREDLYEETYNAFPFSRLFRVKF